MNPRYTHLLVAALSFLSLFGLDFWVNNRTHFDSQIILYCALAAFFHLIAFEAVILKSKVLTTLVWGLAFAIIALSFFFIDQARERWIVAIFVISYTAILLRYLKQILSDQVKSDKGPAN